MTIAAASSRFPRWFKKQPVMHLAVLIIFPLLVDSCFFYLAQLSPPLLIMYAVLSSQLQQCVAIFSFKSDSLIQPRGRQAKLMWWAGRLPYLTIFLEPSISKQYRFSVREWSSCFSNSSHTVAGSKISNISKSHGIGQCCRNVTNALEIILGQTDLNSQSMSLYCQQGCTELSSGPEMGQLNSTEYWHF